MSRSVMACRPISIHTPLAGSDPIAHIPRHVTELISIHTPLAGERPPCSDGRRNMTRFQSTLPLRGATYCPESRWECGSDSNPHSPCGERPQLLLDWRSTMLFQSTLPLREVTLPAHHLVHGLEFQSTLPLRGVTGRVFEHVHELHVISIHTPLARSDVRRFEHFIPAKISIHTPLARSDAPQNTLVIDGGISIHTPLARSDCRVTLSVRLPAYFNPHSPCEE